MTRTGMVRADIAPGNRQRQAQWPLSAKFRGHEGCISLSPPGQLGRQPIPLLFAAAFCSLNLENDRCPPS
jgi:hypothetical protein